MPTANSAPTMLGWAVDVAACIVQNASRKNDRWKRT